MLPTGVPRTGGDEPAATSLEREMHGLVFPAQAGMNRRLEDHAFVVTEHVFPAQAGMNRHCGLLLYRCLRRVFPAQAGMNRTVLRIWSCHVRGGIVFPAQAGMNRPPLKTIWFGPDECSPHRRG